jgi:chromosome partitioning protein
MVTKDPDSVPNGRVLSAINLKGGVGKTTLVLALAETISNFVLKVDGQTRVPRVLAIDLDPQTNLSWAIAPQGLVDQKYSEHKTIYHFFKNVIDKDKELGSLSLSPYIIQGQSNVSRMKGPDLVLSAPDLGQLDEDLLERFERGSPPAADLRIALWKAFQNDRLTEKYDFIFIDCPPSLSVYTTNAIIASDFYFVPVIPEKLSTLGLDLIQTRIAILSSRYAPVAVKLGLLIHVEYLGMILNKVDITRSAHKDRSAQLFNDKRNKVFDNWLGDVVPFYYVTDYEYPSFKFGSYGSGKWPSLEQKYGGSETRQNVKEAGHPLTRAAQGAPFYHPYERVKALALELVTRSQPGKKIEVVKSGS